MSESPSPIPTLDELVEEIANESRPRDGCEFAVLGMLTYEAERSRFTNMDLNAIRLRCKRMAMVIDLCNWHINGPDAWTRNDRLQTVRADLTYVVSQLQFDLGELLTSAILHTQPFKTLLALSQCLFMITYPWNQLLAGDIGDVLESLKAQQFCSEYEFDPLLIITQADLDGRLL